MYKLETIIKNPSEPSLAEEVSFHPGGTMFAVTYGNPMSEVHIFDSITLTRKYVLKNPNSELNNPHGILMTKNHLIVSNIFDAKVTSTINVYRLDALTEKPVYVMRPSFEHLREIHSIDIHNDIVSMTFCESATKTGAVVSYRFNDDTGEFSEYIDIQEECFEGLGDTKGISFNHDGTQLYVTFQSLRAYNFVEKRLLKLFRLKNKLLENGLIGYMRLKREKIKNKEKRKVSKKPFRNPLDPNLKNGIVVFDIDKDGKMSDQPSKTIIRKEFCRYENIKLYDKKLLLTDTINNKVLFFDVVSDPDLEHPTEIVTDSMTMPHGAKLSPDQSMLVVTNFGLNTIGRQILWGNWTKKRGDNVLVFKRN